MSDDLASFTFRPAHLWVSGSSRLEEEVRPYSERHRGECVAAVFHFTGDRDAAHREAAHATVLRALADDWRTSPRTEQSGRTVSWEAFLGKGEPGLLYTMFDGPYPTRIAGDRQAAAVWWLGELLGDLIEPQEMEVRAWSTEGYDAWFRSGREWWGTFLWTVAWEARGRLLGLTASSTD